MAKVRIIFDLLTHLLAYNAVQSAENHLTFRRKMAVDFQRTTRRYILEDRNLYNHRCENLKSYRVIRLVNDEDVEGSGRSHI
jgi:hypothetical protein